MKYKILILSNIENEEIIEDLMIKKRFEQDGNIVDIEWIDYDNSLDKYYDLIIRRNAWVGTEDKIECYKKKNDLLIERLRDSKKTINLVGLDGKGKNYLKTLYYKNMNVIPTTDIVEDALKWNCEEYVLKTKDSFGSGLGQIFISKESLKNKFNDKFLIQPKLKFKSEVQAYFINNQLMYVYEYIPSKYPNYPEPKLINLSVEEEKLAKSFSNISDIQIGMKRIDFLRLEDNSLILLEIEDNSPHMDIEKLDEKIQKKVLDLYVNGIYEYIKNLK